MPIPNLNKNIILACHITGVFDVNRNNTLQSDDYSLVKDWADSITALNLQGVIFHNNFTGKTVSTFQSENVVFVEIKYSNQFNPNIFRYFAYRDFLDQYPAIENLFITDISDVVVVQNPFEQALFSKNTEKIFCGDEPKQLDNEWINNHSNHLRSKISDYASYEKKFADETLLNCGIIGANRKIMTEFLNELCSIHENYNFDNKTAYTGDMGAFNYLVRTKFNTRLIHGEPVNTIFKGYQDDRKDCWFRHK